MNDAHALMLSMSACEWKNECSEWKHVKRYKACAKGTIHLKRKVLNMMRFEDDTYMYSAQ